MLALIQRYPRFFFKQLVGVIWLMSLFNVPANAQNNIPQEYQVKAAFLFHFTQFVEWPTHSFSAPSDPFVIGILGTDPFGSFLDELVRGESVRGHPIIIQRYQDASEVNLTHILFISRDMAPFLNPVLTALKGKSMLTVSEINDFAQQGGMIKFYITNNKIKFQVNVGAARSSGLNMSSKFLRLADICCNGDD